MAAHRQLRGSVHAAGLATGDDAFQPFAIGLLRVEAGRIAELVAFHDPALFPLFDLPATPSHEGG